MRAVTFFYLILIIASLCPRDIFAQQSGRPNAVTMAPKIPTHALPELAAIGRGLESDHYFILPRGAEGASVGLHSERRYWDVVLDNPPQEHCPDCPPPISIPMPTPPIDPKPLPENSN